MTLLICVCDEIHSQMLTLKFQFRFIVIISLNGTNSDSVLGQFYIITDVGGQKLS